MIAIYTLTSELHDEQAVGAVTNEFLSSLGIDYTLKGSDYTDYGNGEALSLIYVRTGGTEGIFKRLLPDLLAKAGRCPFYLLTSGKSNSLAASMEILSYLRQQQLSGEILHGGPTYISHRIALLEQTKKARRQLAGCRLGIIGKQSDWLISSHADRSTIKERLGIELEDIPMQEVLDAIAKTSHSTVYTAHDDTAVGRSLPKALHIYEAVKAVVHSHKLQGFTLRCFDLLSTVHNTGCLALAKLNAEGIVAGCEGDVPAMLSVSLARALTGLSGFQANPASIDTNTGSIVFAHCTIPLNMVERYELDTHFESGIGVGIRGYMKPGPVTVFKVSGDLSRHFIAEGELIENQAKQDLCRTQQLIRLKNKDSMAYFLTEPIGNHHIIVPGHRCELFEELLK